MEEKKQRKKKIVIILAISVVILAIIGGIVFIMQKANLDTTQTSSNIEEQPKVQEFSSSNENIDTLNGTTYMTGKITNLTDNIYENVVVECILYDESGAELEKVQGITYYLGANKDFNFYAFSQNGIKWTKVKSYVVSSIKGTVLSKDKIITDKFSIYNTKINAFYNSSPSFKYHIKNISNIDYSEPITVVHSVKETTTGINYTYYEELHSLKANAIKECSTFDTVGSKLPELTSATLNTKYDIEYSCVLLGSIKGNENVNVKVPRVTGLTYEEAKQQIELENLKVEKIEQVSEKVEKNYIIKQEPDYNIVVKSGSTVKLYVSRGTE